MPFIFRIKEMSTMKAKRIISCVIFGLIFLISTHVHAQTNATIINGNVHLRKTYPTFGVSTLFKFKLSPGESMAIIQEGTRIEVLTKIIVAKKYEWFEVIYNQNNKSLRGWVYAGDVENRKYLKFDPSAERKVRLISQNSFSSIRGKQESSFLSFRDVYAQAVDAVNEPEIKTNSLKTLIFGAIYVIIFMGSLFFSKKWIFPNSNLFTFLSSLGVLLILGFISETVFSEAIARILL